MLNILCVDDDLLQHENLKQMFASTDIVTQVSYFEGSDDFFFALEDFKEIDAVFLDIEMEKMHGIEIAEVLRSKGYTFPIVFITGYTQYAIDGYSVQAYDYILKPIQLDKFRNLLQRIEDDKNNNTSIHHFFDTEDGSVKYKESDILGFEAQDNGVLMILEDHAVIVKMTLSSIASFLSTAFIQTHRSYMVNIEQIKSLNKEDIILNNDDIIPISRRLRADVHKTISNYYKKEGYQL